MTGRDIIKDVMHRYRIGPKDFFGSSRLPRLVKARRSAAKQMFEAGLSVPVISRLMQRNPRTISYHLNPIQRERSLARSRQYYVAKCDERRSYWTTEYRRNRAAGAQS